MNALFSLSRFVGNTFAIWTLIFAAAGFFLPEMFVPLKGSINWLLGIIMFGMGLTLSARDFSEVIKRPLDVLVGVIAQFAIMPLLALLLTMVFNLDPMLAIGVLLVGCCPGGTSSNVITYLSRGDVALSVTITSVTTLMAPVVTPLLLTLLASKYLDIQAGPLFVSIVTVVIAPIVLGGIVRLLLKDRVNKVTPLLPLISVTGIVLIVATVVALNQARLQEIGLLVLAVVILHNLLGYALGYLVARLRGMPMAQRKTLAVEVGMQNSGLGAMLATAHFSPLSAVPSALFSVWHNISGALLATWFRRLNN